MIARVSGSTSNYPSLVVQRALFSFECALSLSKGHHERRTAVRPQPDSNFVVNTNSVNIQQPVVASYMAIWTKYIHRLAENTPHTPTQETSERGTKVTPKIKAIRGLKKKKHHDSFGN